jgi:predicted metal-dependent hydrolase
MPSRRPNPAAADTRHVAGIEFELVFKRVKRLSLRIYPPDGRVRLTAPRGTPRAAIEAAVASRTDWIRQHQDRFRALPQPQATLYETGETHYVSGEPYQLQLRLAQRGRVELAGDRLLLPATAGCSRSDRALRLEQWYRGRLQAALPALVSTWSERLGVAEPEYRVKRMTTRWGSCNPRARRIWLALALAQRRPALLEYVVVHELAHLLEPNHGPGFQALMLRLMPGWQALDRELDAWPIWSRLPAAQDS